MKILLIGTDTKIFEDGSSVRRRFEGFSALAEEVHIVIARPSFDKSISHVAVNVYAYPTASQSNLSAIINSLFVGYRIIQRDKKSDWVISVQDPFEQGWVGYILSLILRKSLHVQVHTDMLSPFFTRGSFLNHLRVALSQPILRSAKRIRVDALRMKNSIIKKFGISAEKIDILQIYIDIASMVFETDEKKIEGDYILYVGRFESEKNVESIIRGFAMSSHNFPTLRLVLLGGGGMQSYYERLAFELGISEKLIIIPWTNSVGSYMRHAKALVLASWYEGFALVLVEAIMNECPIITTDVGAVGGIVPREIAHIFPQDDDRALCERIGFVLRNHEEEKKKISEAKLQVQEAIPKDMSEYSRIFRKSLEKSL